MRRPPKELQPGPRLASTEAPADERRFFEAEMKGVRPLAGKGRPLPPTDLAVRPSAPAGPRPPVLGEVGLVEGDVFRALDVSLEAVRELRRGDRRPEAELDLHGMTGDQADAALMTFVAQATRGGRRVLLVIHGRGRGSGPAGPVLRARLMARATSRPLVARLLAAVPAPESMGGEGATLLWLRRNG